MSVGSKTYFLGANLDAELPGSSYVRGKAPLFQTSRHHVTKLACKRETNGFLIEGKPNIY